MPRESWNPMARRRERAERRLQALEEMRLLRRLVHDDVTALGEQVAELASRADDHADSRRDHELALARYEGAKPALERAREVDDVRAVERGLVEARFLLARVVARREGHDLPRPREECFFDPRHGPAVTDVRWTPPHGAEREIAVCMRDRDRLLDGEPPAIRTVRVGDRWVPWHEADLVASGRLSEAALRLSPAARLAAAEAHIRGGVGRADPSGFGGGPLG